MNPIRMKWKPKLAKAGVLSTEENEAYICYPCQHSNYCKECVNKVFAGPKKCVLCRAPISKVEPLVDMFINYFTKKLFEESKSFHDKAMKIFIKTLREETKETISQYSRALTCGNNDVLKLVHLDKNQWKFSSSNPYFCCNFYTDT